MKKINILILISLFLISFNIKISGQEDTVIIENSIEPVNESDFKQKREYKYLDNNFREEKTILKLGTKPMYYFMYYNSGDLAFLTHFNIHFSFEKKISTSFSIILDDGYFNEPTMGSNGYDYCYYNNIGTRYYYSMKTRIKQGKGANNFHGNYFSIVLEELTKYALTKEIDYSYNYKITRGWTFNPYLNLSWGMQRRIGKYGIVDAGTYFKFRSNEYEFGLNLLVGLGLGLKK